MLGQGGGLLLQRLGEDLAGTVLFADQPGRFDGLAQLGLGRFSALASPLAAARAIAWAASCSPWRAVSCICWASQSLLQLGLLTFQQGGTFESRLGFGFMPGDVLSRRGQAFEVGGLLIDPLDHVRKRAQPAPGWPAWYPPAGGA
ncbi:hypothetical protein ACFSVK_16055 [Azorhizophilus paspali]|uniref:hypothetical protein n=1 Tax=Azorhizophilus paspali TaxID=69963 RepID=UPI0036290FE0